MLGHDYIRGKKEPTNFRDSEDSTAFAYPLATTDNC